MKKLLQINTVVNSGSTGRIAEEIGQLALKNGWQSYIAFGRNVRKSKSERFLAAIAFSTCWSCEASTGKASCEGCFVRIASSIR